MEKKEEKPKEKEKEPAKEREKEKETDKEKEKDKEVETPPEKDKDKEKEKEHWQGGQWLAAQGRECTSPLLHAALFDSGGKAPARDGCALYQIPYSLTHATGSEPNAQLAQNKNWEWDSWREDDGAKPQAR